MERVQKIIAASGLCSRRAADILVEEGRVTVNGKRVELGTKADPDKDIVKVDGRQIQKAEKVYIALYKPRHVETTLARDTQKRTITQFLPKVERLYPVGRLDFDAEGLLICTNDGDFANRIMHPSFEVEKSYVAELRQGLTEEHEFEIRKGLLLEDGPVTDIGLTCLDEKRKKWELTIHEGRHKIVKRIFKELGYFVGNLTRVRIGPIKLGNLKVGRYRPLKKGEIDEMIAITQEAKPRKQLSTKRFSELKDLRKKKEAQDKVERAAREESEERIRAFGDKKRRGGPRERNDHSDDGSHPHRPRRP